VGLLGGLSTPLFQCAFQKLYIILLKQKPVVVNYKTGVNNSNALPVNIVILFKKNSNQISLKNKSLNFLSSTPPPSKIFWERHCY